MLHSVARLFFFDPGSGLPNILLTFHTAVFTLCSRLFKKHIHGAPFLLDIFPTNVIGIIQETIMNYFIDFLLNFLFTFIVLWALVVSLTVWDLLIENRPPVSLLLLLLTDHLALIILSFCSLVTQPSASSSPDHAH